MKAVILLSFLFSFIFLGCAEKELQIVFKDKFVCIEQQTIPRVQETQIRVHNEDVNVALEYKAAIDMGLNFYEEQVNRNNKFCKDIGGLK